MEIFNYIQSRANNEIVPAMEKIIQKNKQPKEVYNLIWEFLNLGGKRFRPIMTLLCCESLKGDVEKAIYPAMAIEFFHNFTLIHDDIEDNSQMRRGKQCLHIRFGEPLAINAGDGLYNFVWETIINAPLDCDKKIELQKILSKAFLEVLEGQATEIGWHHRKEWDINEENYLKMIGGKTGALIGASCEVGICIGNGDEQTKRLYNNFGRAIGLSFQIQDDILNIVGDFEKYKKEIMGDITEGKRTLMILKTLEQCTPEERKLIITTLDSHTTDTKELNMIAELMKKYKAIEYAKNKAYNIIKNAKEDLEKNTQQNEARDKLMEISDFFLTREL